MEPLTLVVATKNPGKLREIASLTADLPLLLRPLGDYPNLEVIKEDGTTFFENALRKATRAMQCTRTAAIADDSGLEVDALQGAPGIYSARYAGEGASDEENVQKLLAAMTGVPPERRGAQFRCVLVLAEPEKEPVAFEGIWRGRISMEPAGRGGFGYDPVFLLPERGVTVSQLSLEEKNRLSHRAQALRRLRDWLLERGRPRR